MDGSIHNFAGSNGLPDSIDAAAATRYDPLTKAGPGVYCQRGSTFSPEPQLPAVG